MRQCIIFPLVFALGLLLADFLPSKLEPSSQKSHDLIPADGKHSRQSDSGSRFNSARFNLPEKAENGVQNRPTELRVDGYFLKRDIRRPCMNLPKEADCDPRARILVINSAGEGGQMWRDHINREFSKAGLAGHYKFWPAELEESRKGQSRDGQSGSQRSPGLTLSHKSIYKVLLDMRWACATIFEDNVTLVDDFLARLTSITVTESIPPFDVICWGWGSSGLHNAAPQGKPELAYGRPGPCLFAYTVSLQGALMLLQSMSVQLADGEINGTAWKQNIGPAIDRSAELMPGSYWHVVPRMAFQG